MTYIPWKANALDSIMNYLSVYNAKLVRLNDAPDTSLGIDYAVPWTGYDNGQTMSFAQAQYATDANLLSTVTLSTSGLFHIPTKITNAAIASPVMYFDATLDPSGPSVQTVGVALIQNSQGGASPFQQMSFYLPFATWSTTSKMLGQVWYSWGLLPASVSASDVVAQSQPQSDISSDPTIINNNSNRVSKIVPHVINPFNIDDDDDKDKEKDKKKDDDDDDDDMEYRKHCVDHVWKQKDPCSFVRSFHCHGVGVGSLARYAENYVIFVLNLFSIAGIIASEFFGTGFKTLLSRTGMATATVTALLLAFGNGSMETFASIGAMRTGQVNLAFGELVSSAFFTATLGIGAVAFLQPFHFVKRAFIRDVAFFIVSMLFVITILSDNDIKLFEVSGFLGLFAFYIFVVTVVADWWGRDHEDETNEAAIPPPFMDDEDETRSGNFGVWDQNQQQRRSRGNEAAPFIVRSVEGILPGKDNLRDGGLQGAATTPGAGGSAGGHSRAGSNSRYGATDDPSATLISSQIQRGQIHSVWSAFAVNEAAERANANPMMDPANIRAPLSSDARHATVVEWLFPTIPIGMVNDPGAWDRRRFWEKTVSVLIAPSVFVVRLTVPIVYLPGGKEGKSVVNVPSGLVFPAAGDGNYGRLPGDDFDEGFGSFRGNLGGASGSAAVPGSVLFDAENPGAGANLGKAATGAASASPIVPPRNLFLVQNFFAGLIVVFVVLDLLTIASRMYTFISWVIGIFVGVGCVYVALNKDLEDSNSLIYFQGLSFATSVAWGYFLGVEIVAVLGAIGMGFGVSATFVGLTIFAFGCNLGEFLTNISLAVHGYTSIAVRASIAAPMLNLLFGLGVSTFYILIFHNEKGIVKPKDPSAPTPTPTPTPTAGSFMAAAAGRIARRQLVDDDGDDEDEITTATSILVLSWALLLSLLFSAVYVPLNQFQATKKYGLILMIWWAVAMGISVIVEVVVGSG
ncbi:hypothetical protein HDU76_003621 [Blyttiomyces sp. JEL0837]|nr:hypothetical protein HDU76_003621 [Blyttiomyces sp. JEL0837]